MKAFQRLLAHKICSFEWSRIHCQALKSRGNTSFWVTLGGSGAHKTARIGQAGEGAVEITRRNRSFSARAGDFAADVPCLPGLSSF